MKNVQVLCHEATQTIPYFYATLILPVEFLPQLFCHSKKKKKKEKKKKKGGGGGDCKYNFSFFNTLLMKDT